MTTRNSLALLRARGQHERAAHHVKHVGAHQPRYGSRHRPAEHESRQQQMPQRILEDGEVAGQQRIDGQEPGDAGGQRQTRIEPARPWQPVQHDREDEQQTKARPEHRQRRAEQSEQPRAMVDQAVAEIGGQHAKHDAERGAEDHRGKDQFERCWQSIENVGADIALGDEGRAEVAAQQVAKIYHIALRQRTIQTPAGLGGGHHFGIAHLLLGDDRRQRIALGHRGDQKSNGDDAEH